MNTSLKLKQKNIGGLGTKDRQTQYRYIKLIIPYVFDGL